MYETIVESWKNLQSFREMAELIGRSIDLHYTLSLSLSLSTSSTTPPLSVLVRREGKRLLAPVQRGERKRRGGRRIGWNRWIALSLLSLSFIDQRSAPPPLFKPSKHGTTPLGADAAKGSLFLSAFLFYFSLSLFLCLFRATSLANRRLILASMHRSTSRTFPLPILSVSSYILYICIYTSSSHVSTLLLENKKILSFSFRHLGKENIVAWRVEKSWNERIFLFRELTDT